MMTNEELLKLTLALASAPAETDTTAWEDRLFRLLEIAVRTLDCELLALQATYQIPEFPLAKSENFPLPDEMAPAAAYLAAYLAGGGAPCKAGYDRALERCRNALQAVITPVVDRYGF